MGEGSRIRPRGEERGKGDKEKKEEEEGEEGEERE